MSSSSTHESSAPSPPSTPQKDATTEEPLYTEINIPLPHIPSPPSTLQQSRQPSRPSSSSSHSRTRSLSSSIFSRTRSSSSPSNPQPLPAAGHYIRPSRLASRETAAAMDLTHQSKRNRRGTIDALAVVPAVLVLSAELFTPGDGEAGRRREKGGGLVGGMR